MVVVHPVMAPAALLVLIITGREAEGEVATPVAQAAGVVVQAMVAAADLLILQQEFLLPQLLFQAPLAAAVEPKAMVNIILAHPAALVESKLHLFNMLQANMLMLTNCVFG